MKAAILAMALQVTVLQTVGVSDCCCILICKHQNEPCSKCGDSRETKAGCCSEDPAVPPSEDERCAHVSPSSEILGHAPAIDLPTAVEALPALFESHVPGSFMTAAREERPREARGSPPLFILHHALLR